MAATNDGRAVAGGPAQPVYITNATGDPVPTTGGGGGGGGGGAVTIADGADITQGAKADAAASTDAGTFSLIALFKRLLGKLATQLPAALGPQTAATSLSVTRPTTTTTTATIANGASLSGAVDLGSVKDVLRLVMPAAWTAASLTLQASEDNSTYNDYYDAYGVEYAIVASTSREVQIPAGDLRGVRYLKIRSGTSASPVNQGAGRDIVIVAR